MFWLQLATLVLINVLVFGMVFSRLPRARHSGGESDYTVWHLIAQVEAERQAAQEESGTGRHRLREPT
ncbi:hypothetical protein [Saccharopolyspora elongata]|uniref:Uncharacterized protein n=1 Tax=Saccharopolyspora elongata TaxID=2530387 RepID=A0A4R4Z0R4_9PSEU|nr:hypothetical protein [Saccharopolyspora elongata]TDD49612.1 hypothetical protein E1288_19050 [Saccharopolyspora elongata]